MGVSEFLRNLDVFDGVTDAEIREIAGLFVQRHLVEEEVLVNEGDTPNALFIVISGRICLTSVGPNRRAQSDTEYVDGEMMFAEGGMPSVEPSPVSATAVTTTSVLRLSTANYERILADHPRIMRNMLLAASRRAQRANLRLLARAPDTRETAHGRVYAVFSTRGGAGKTTLSVMLAAKLSEGAPGRVSLLDLDLLFDDASLSLDLGAHSSLAAMPEELLDKLDRRHLNEYLASSDNGLKVLDAAKRPEEGERITPRHVEVALGAMKRQFDATIVDCGGGLAEATLAALSIADRVVVLCTPEIGAVRDLRACQRIFGQATQVDKRKFYYVLNHAQPGQGLARQQVETALDVPIDLEVAHAGLEAAIDQLARELTPAEAPSSSRHSGLRRFLRRS